MKVYFLRVTGDDLQYSDGRWLTSPIDLYDSEFISNYSVTKSSYGIPSMKTTWIGMYHLGGEMTWDDARLLTWDELREQPWSSGFYTDSGRVILNKRFIDYTGRIDIVSYNLLGDPLGTTLTVYNSDMEEFYEEGWDAAGPFTVSDEISVIDASRKTVLAFDFPTDVLPEGFEAYIRVEIDRPVMAPLYRMTRQLQRQFPEWMAIHKGLDENEVPAIEEPDTLGGQFLNAVAGEWLDDIYKQLSYTEFQRHITTVDLGQMDWAWRTSNTPNIVWSVKGDGEELARTSGIKEFQAAVGEDACYIDFHDNTIYCAKEYDELTVNGEVSFQEPHHMWNYLDEIGLFVDLPRLPREENESYQIRILDTYKNRGGVGVDSLKKALRRELNLWKVVGSEVGSDDDDALPEILEMSDIENDPKYFDPDGMPAPVRDAQGNVVTDSEGRVAGYPFLDLVRDLSYKYPTTWSRFHWGKALWDVAGENYDGFGVVPYRYDVPSLPDNSVQSGVGDGNDLFVFRPDTITGAREFEAKLIARGRERTLRTEYPSVDFDFVVRGKGMRNEYYNPVQEVWLTAEAVLKDGGGTYRASWKMESQSDVSVSNPSPTPASFDEFNLFSEDWSTSPDLQFKGGPANAPYENSGIISIDKIQEIRLRHGRYSDVGYEDQLTSNLFEAWFSHLPGSVLRYNNTGPSYGWVVDPEWVEDPNDPEDPPSTFEPASVIMRSLNVDGPHPEPWRSESFEYHMKLNGVAPYTSPSSVALTLPEVFWDPFATNRVYEIQLETTNDFQLGEGEEHLRAYGAISADENEDAVFVPASLVHVNGNGTWNNGAKEFSTGTTSVTFSTGTGAQYPISFHIWEPFEAEQVGSISGVVDENGPWKNGQPGPQGSYNSTLETVENLTRADFGIPDSEDFMVTWMGVSADNPRVIVWLDSNVVHPAHPNEDLEYPETSIQEAEDGGAFYYEPFLLKARLRPVDPEWNPQVHSGFFYDKNQEYYFYANKQTETATGTEHVLDGVARQGAPIIVRDGEVVLRQVAFFDEDATPVALSLINTQYVRGSGEPRLYLAYEDVYEVEVRDSKGEIVPSDTSTSTHILGVAQTTEHEEVYTVTYKLRNSFYADNDYIESGDQRTRLVFDSAPQSEYVIDYEGNSYDPATPVDLPLNPLHTMQTEGFVFISHNEYTLDTVEVFLSPDQLLSDGQDYMMITLHSMDRFANPKPHQHFALSTTFGQLDKTQVTTDIDGYAIVILTSVNTQSPPASGTLTITGGVNATAEFKVEAPELPKPSLYAVVKSEQIQADGESRNYVYGKVLDANFQPVAGAQVTWDKARFLYELFTGEEVLPDREGGSVPTGADGSFVVGPFTAAASDESGYWFVSLEATVSGVTIGDVVFWYEYPTAVYGVENVSGLPQKPVQWSIQTHEVPEYSDEVKYPVSYNEEEELPVGADPEINWLPPVWFAIPAWRQHQLGIDSHDVHRAM